jgi:zinc transport system permease protein
MIEFFGALLTHGFLQNALMAALLASVGCGIVGTFVVVKRIGYLAGGIAHSVLGGLGIAYYMGADPRTGAMVAAVAAALIIAGVSLRWKEHEDVVIGALWAVGMAIGIVFISQTPGYNVDLMSYLFGNILMVSRTDLYVMAGLDVIVGALGALFYKQLLVVCFDEEFAHIRGVNVAAVYVLLLCMVAVTVVSMIQVVGLILVIALLTLPVAIAGHFVGSVAAMIVVACVLGATFSFAGLGVSYAGNLPSGATIILLAGVSYLVSLAARLLRRRIIRGQSHQVRG